jgi:CubicO group peptidase (beta-lactamase class C family)
MQKRFTWFAASFLVITLASAPNGPLCQTPQQIRSVGEFYARTDGFSGNVVVFRNGSILSNESYGLANIELGVPITANTRFAIGSLTKQFTAASILLLQEQGLLKTTDTLAQHYPATPALWKDVTLRQLLQHTSGIPDGLESWGTPAFEQTQHPPEDIIKSVASKPLVFPSGSRMEYNNMGYILLGLVVERVSKQSYADFLQQHFFTPLQMQNTGLGSSSALIQNRAYGYAPELNGLHPADPVPFTSSFSAGGLYSTGEDLARWLIALHGGRVLKPASYTEMTTAGLEGFGYGLIISTQSGKVDFYHAGRVSGFASEFEYFPETKTGIVVLSNKLSHNVSPGANALDTDLVHLSIEQNAAVRSLGGERHVEPATLRRYTGTYQPISKDDGIPVTIERNDGHLTLTPAGKGTSTLIARSDDAFYVKENEWEAEFHKDADGSWLLNVFILPTQTMLSLRKSPTKD